MNEARETAGFSASCCSNETRAVVLGEGISNAERERRAKLLDRLDAKVARDGFHRARHDPDGAAQFLPYKSLKGLEELLHEQAAERRAADEAL